MSDQLCVSDRVSFPVKEFESVSIIIGSVIIKELSRFMKV